MKTICEKRLVFITPAFLSGANQNQPEIRVPSIRGAIRWWLRVLGGTPGQEASVFGGVHGGAQASKAVVRVEAVQINRGETIRAPQGTPRGYLYYFATVSGNKDGVHRTEQGHYVAPDSSFRLKVFLRQELAEEDEALLLLAIDAFLALGSLGLRATRGCGAFAVSILRRRNASRPCLCFFKTCGARPSAQVRNSLHSASVWARPGSPRLLSCVPAR